MASVVVAVAGRVVGGVLLQLFELSSQWLFIQESIHKNIHIYIYIWLVWCIYNLL
jgi:hypothetical protein